MLDADVDGNTPMHHAYAQNQPLVRDLLRSYIDDDEAFKDVLKSAVNNSGEVPHEMYHNVKFTLTDTDESDDVVSEGELNR